MNNRCFFLRINDAERLSVLNNFGKHLYLLILNLTPCLLRYSFIMEISNEEFVYFGIIFLRHDYPHISLHLPHLFCGIKLDNRSFFLFRIIFV